MPLFFSGKAYLPVPDASGGGAAEVSFKNPRRATPSDGALGLTIAPRLEPQEITWQLVDASIAISIGSACSVRTSVRHGPFVAAKLAWVSLSSPPPAARARTALAAYAPNLPPDRWRFSRP